VLEHIRINTVTEANIDEVVSSAGGDRIVCEGPDKPQNADYLLNEAIIELKLIEEEGLSKKERRVKISELFNPTQPTRPVVVIDPTLLSQESKRKYYNLLARPIQSAICKAASQLEKTQQYTRLGTTRVLLILNNGYSALSPDEFNSMVSKSLRHDTTKIDHAIIAGIYYYSDTFDSYIITHFEHIPINVDRPFPSYDSLLASWNEWLHNFMNAMISRESVDPAGKFPVVDLKFVVDGITYLKPAPPIGGPSKLWPEGKRPRINSTGIDKCPPVAVCFPKITEVEWQAFCALVINREKLRSSYAQWLKFAREAKADGTEPQRPFVEVPITADGFKQWASQGGRDMTFRSMVSYSTEMFQCLIHKVIKNAKNIGETQIRPVTYIFLLVSELGQDKANDISSIYLVSTVPGFERKTPLLENVRSFFEHSLGVAAAYAISEAIPFVYYDIDRTYGWI
jgi:hypothetical protein